MSDMRQLFRSVKDELPPAPFTVDQITERGRRSRRRRTLARNISIAGAAAVLTAVAAAGMPYLHGGSAPQAPAETGGTTRASAPAVPAFTTTVRAFTVGKDFAVQASAEVTPGYESARVIRPHAVEIGEPGGIVQQSGVLTVYRPGVFDPADYAAGGPATVNGHPGFTRTFARAVQIADPKDPAKTVEHTMRLASIAWQYAAGAWATVTATDDGRYYGMTAAQVKMVAATFVPHFGGAVAAAPYSIGSLPPGWKVASAGSDDVTVLSSGTGAISHVYLARADLSFTGLTGRIDLDTGRDAGILLTVQRNDTDGPARHPFADPACQNATGGEGAFCDRAIGSSGFYLEAVDQSRRLTGAQVDEISQGLRFTDPADTGTWIPVA